MMLIIDWLVALSPLIASGALFMVFGHLHRTESYRIRK